MQCVFVALCRKSLIGFLAMVFHMVASAGPAQDPVAATDPDYVDTIKPIFRQHCFACHGAIRQQGGLRLDTAALMNIGGDAGPVIAAGSPDDSLLMQRILSSDESLRMPREGMPLTRKEVTLIRDWIRLGAHAVPNEVPDVDPGEHWAFQKPVRATLPRRQKGAVAGNPVDAFVLARLDEAGLSPRPIASKPTLLRRVTLNLIGLPPTRDELHAFQADTSLNAYAAVVDRLLSDQRYGERWGRHWMDVWRYADWHGRRYVPDVWNSAPQVWRWRDWIVESLNQDHGYDRMLREMLAADEVAAEDPTAAVATGYLIRNWYALNPNDWMRANVEHTSKAFLGLTLNCAHCHDHKYDPITQDDYFRFRALFEPIHIRQDRVAGEADPGPFQEYDYGVLRKIQRLGAVQVYDRTPEAPTWFYSGGDERNRLTDRGSMVPGMPVFLSSDSAAIEPVTLPLYAWYPSLRPDILNAILVAHRALTTDAQTKLGIVRSEIESRLPPLREKLAAAEAEFAQATHDADAKGNETTVAVDPHLHALQREIAAQELRVTSLETGIIATNAEITGIETRAAADTAKYGDDTGTDSDALARIASQRHRESIVRRAEADVVLHDLALAVAETKPTTDANRAAEIEAAGKLLAAARETRDKAAAALSDPALAAVYPSIGPTYPRTSTGRRRALARWITSPDNPLAARVAINHIWLRHFHVPLVSTVFDFGRNGSRPTHPELLDWLAVELMESDWSMKQIHRLIVMSETYQQASSVGDPAQYAVDSENTLLWRMNTGRMEAEVVRDSLLFVAGKLDLTQGGQELENSEALKSCRRTLYYSCQPEADGRSEFGALFDAPEPADCYRRTRSIIPQQSLALINSDFVQELSIHLATTLWQDPAPGQEADPQLFVTAAFEQILGRVPTENERSLCVEFLQEKITPADSTPALEAATTGSATSSPSGPREAIVRALLNHNDFISIR